MSHEIETHDDQAAAIYGNREAAWHGLGTVMDGNFTALEAMKIAHLGDWNVRKTPLYTLIEAGDETIATKVEGQFATVRDNPFVPGQVDHLGVVGAKYTPFQNEDSADFLDMLVHESGATLDTAGSLNEGRETFFSMKLPDHILVGGEDRVDLNLAILNSHDGTSAIRPLLSTVRVVCKNTFNMALNHNVGMATVRHTSSAKARIEEVRQLLGLEMKRHEEFEAEAEKMIQEAMTKRQFEKVVHTIFPEPDRVTATDRVKNTWAAQKDSLFSLFLGEIETQAKIKETRWGAFNAFTEYVDWTQPIRTAAATPKDRQAARFERAMIGTGATIKNKAWDLTKV